MSGLANLVVKHKKAILALFIAAAAICAVLQSFVAVNYNMVDYLPPEAQSTKALEIMQEEFDADMPNASVMVKDVSIEEALAYKQKLAEVSGVDSVLWLDDVADLKQPLETADAETVQGLSLIHIFIWRSPILRGGAARCWKRTTRICWTNLAAM